MDVALLMAVSLVTASMLPGAAQAQDATSTRADTTSRTEQLSEMRREKARSLEPPKAPAGIEKLLAGIEERMAGSGGGGVGFMGFRPVLGGLRPGAGMAAGVRFEPFGSDGRVLATLGASASVKKYWGVRALAGYRLDPILVAAYGRHLHMPQERFFGIGEGGRLESESTYRINETDAGVLASLQASPAFSLGFQAGYVAADPGPGKDSDFPTTHERFDDLPALNVSTEHYLVGGWIRFDSRDPAPRRRFLKDLSPLESGFERMPLATKRGIFAQIELVDHTSLGSQRFGFQRLHVQSQQYVPFRHGYQLFAFREYLVLSRTDQTEVPFFMLPTLGGAYTLRGYEIFRFRDRNALLLNAEYRWNIWRLADLVLFADAGQVFEEPDEVSLDDLHTNYGGGFRIRTRNTGLLRVEVARSAEGTQLIVLVTSSF